MDLIEIDCLDAKSFQAGFASLHDVLARQAAHVRAFTHWEMHLGRKDYLFHFCHLAKCAAGHLLARAHRVHVGRIEEVDPEIERSSIERLCFRFIENPRPPLRGSVTHAAKTDPGDDEAAVAEWCVLHGVVGESTRCISPVSYTHLTLPT